MCQDYEVEAESEYVCLFGQTFYLKIPRV
jgi:hypothetical protein